MKRHNTIANPFRITRIVCVLSFLLAAPLVSSAQILEFTSREMQRLEGRTVVFVLPDFKDAPVRHDSLKRETQKYWLTRLQRWWDLGAKKGWKSTLPLMTVLHSKVDSLPKDKQYLFVEIPSLKQIEYSWQYMMHSDSAILYRDRQSFTFQNKYAYLKLRFSDQNGPFYTWYFTTLIPTSLDIYEAMLTISGIVELRKNEKEKGLENQAPLNHNLLKTKTLSVDSAAVSRVSKKFNYIATEYPYPVKLSTHASIERSVMSGTDSTAILFTIPVPDPLAKNESYTGTTYSAMLNSRERIFYYMHIVFDNSSGKILYTNKTEDPKVLVRDWKKLGPRD